MSKLQSAAALKAAARRVCPAGQATPSRATSRTTSLPFKQAKEIINALAFGETQLPPATPWLHITMVLDQSEYGVAEARDYLALQGRVLRAVRRFLHAKHLPAHYFWVREIGPRDGRHHTHLLLSAPPHLRDDLAELIRRVGELHDTSNNRAVEITPKTNRWTGKTDTKGLHTRAQRAGVLRDLLKTMSPKAVLDGVPVMPALDIRPRAACTIHGKRSGTSESLSRAARERTGWRELETLHELRSVLPTGAEARKERQRQRQRQGKRRYRERKRDATAPVPAPTPSKLAWKATADSLPDDFFDGDDFFEEPKEAAAFAS